MDYSNDLGNLTTVQKELNPALFSEGKLKPNVRKLFINILGYFTKGVVGFDVDEIIFETITITGSSVNYNYTKDSDIDIHILIDPAKYSGKNYDNLLKYLRSTTQTWNLEHDKFKLFGHNMELYIQETTEPHNSSGVYDVIADEWITEPGEMKPSFDSDKIKEDYARLVKCIRYLIEKDKPLDDVEEFVDALKLYRKQGLTRDGELSTENIVYKLLRYQKHIEKLYDYKKQINITGNI